VTLDIENLGVSTLGVLGIAMLCVGLPETCGVRFSSSLYSKSYVCVGAIGVATLDEGTVGDATLCRILRRIRSTVPASGQQACDARRRVAIVVSCHLEAHLLYAIWNLVSECGQ
jgi:hypothetical protein